MSDLTEFLLARIDEDEAVARTAIDPRRPGTHWQWVDPRSDEVLADPEGGFRVSLRTVEEFPTTSGVGDLPAFPLGYVEADETYALPHIARHDPARVLAECEAKRRIVELHEAWPVMVETRPEFEPVGGDASTMTFRMSQQIAWLTTQEYRARFGDEPPAAPMLRHLASVYADHPDYRDEWKL